jgi:hypothetical protein
MNKIHEIKLIIYDFDCKSFYIYSFRRFSSDKTDMQSILAFL